jgi:hypothetical protein
MGNGSFYRNTVKEDSFLGAFAELLRATISFVCLYVCPSAWYSWAPAGRILLKFNPLNAELSPICPLIALFGAHHILHVSS